MKSPKQNSAQKRRELECVKNKMFGRMAGLLVAFLLFSLFRLVA